MSDLHDVGNSAAAVVIRVAHRPGFMGASLMFSRAESGSPYV